MKGSVLAAEIIEEMKRKEVYKKKAEEKKKQEENIQNKDRNEGKL